MEEMPNNLEKLTITLSNKLQNLALSDRTAAHSHQPQHLQKSMPTLQTCHCSIIGPLTFFFFLATRFWNTQPQYVSIVESLASSVLDSRVVSVFTVHRRTLHVPL